MSPPQFLLQLRYASVSLPFPTLPNDLLPGLQPLGRPHPQSSTLGCYAGSECSRTPSSSPEGLLGIVERQVYAGAVTVPLPQELVDTPILARLLGGYLGVKISTTPLCQKMP